MNVPIPSIDCKKDRTEHSVSYPASNYFLQPQYPRCSNSPRDRRMRQIRSDVRAKETRDNLRFSFRTKLFESCVSQF